MKLRLTSDAIRLRLGPAEVDRLVRTGAVAHLTRFPAGPSLGFTLVADPSATAVSAAFDGSTVRVGVPAAAVRRWAAAADQVSIRAEQPLADGPPLSILIEKDFACLHGQRQGEGDTFPNPAEG